MAKYNLSILPVERSYQYSIIKLEPNQVTYMICPPARKTSNSDVLVNANGGLLATINWAEHSDARRYINYDAMKQLFRKLPLSAVTITPYQKAKVHIPRLFEEDLVTNSVDAKKTPKAKLTGYWVLQADHDIYLIRFNNDGLIVRFHVAEQTQEPTKATKRRRVKAAPTDETPPPNNPVDEKPATEKKPVKRRGRPPRLTAQH